MIERHRKEGREKKEERARQIGKRERGMGWSSGDGARFCQGFSSCLG